MTRFSERWRFDSLRDQIAVTDEHVAHLSTTLGKMELQLVAIMKRLDRMTQTIEASKLMPKILHGAVDPHKLSEAWWIVQPERGTNGKVELAYWGPFQSEVAAKESPLWNPRKNQRCFFLTNPLQ